MGGDFVPEDGWVDVAKKPVENDDIDTFDKTISDPDKGMYECAKIGSMNGVQYYISKGANDWNGGMVYAAENGHRDIVDLMISKGANDWDTGMACAAENGHRDIVDLMISKGANDWDTGMACAAENGHRDIVDLMISKGANVWTWGMLCATKNGHRDIVDLMISKGATNFTESLDYAKRYNQTDLIELFERKINEAKTNNDVSNNTFDKTISDPEKGMCECIKIGSLEGVQFYISQGANNWNYGMVCAAENGHRNIVDLMISKGANNWNRGMFGAARKGHRDLVDFFIEKGANDWNSGMFYAIENDHRVLVDLMISKGANDWINGLGFAKQYKHNDLIKLFERQMNVADTNNDVSNKTFDKTISDPEKGMFECAKIGSLDGVQFYISKGANDWHYGMSGAIKNGNRDLVDFFILKGSDVLFGLYWAKYYNHKDLIELFEKKIKETKKTFDKTISDPNKGMVECAKIGSLDGVQFYISKGATNYWNFGMSSAAENGHRDIVDLMISKGANIWNTGMISAIKNRHRDLVDFFIEKGANDWDLGLEYAARSGHQDLVDFFIEKGAGKFDLGMSAAAQGGHQDLVDFFILKGATDWNRGMWGAAKGGFRNLVDFMISKGATDWNRGMYGAAMHGNRDIVDLMISKGANDWSGGLVRAKDYRHTDLIEFFESKLSGLVQKPTLPTTHQNDIVDLTSLNPDAAYAVVKDTKLPRIFTMSDKSLTFLKQDYDIEVLFNDTCCVKKLLLKNLVTKYLLVSYDARDNTMFLVDNPYLCLWYNSIDDIKKTVEKNKHTTPNYYYLLSVKVTFDRSCDILYGSNIVHGDPLPCKTEHVCLPSHLIKDTDYLYPFSHPIPKPGKNQGMVRVFRNPNGKTAVDSDSGITSNVYDFNPNFRDHAIVRISWSDDDVAWLDETKTPLKLARKIHKASIDWIVD